MWKNEKEIFSALNTELLEKNIFLEVICVGGFVLSHNGMRAIQNINGFFETNAIITSIITEVGNRFGINTVDEIWLNNSVQNLNDKPDINICQLLYDFSNLKVYLAPLDYVAGMKLNSCREQDILDVAEIIKFKKIKDPKKLEKILEDYGFMKFDKSVILESFGHAYGMDWLENYYISHEKEIIDGL